MSELDNMLKSLCPDGVDYKPLGELGSFIRGNGLQKKDFTEEGVGCIHYGQIYTYYGLFASETKTRVSEALANKLTWIENGDLVIACTSENMEDVCKAVAWLGNEPIVTGGHSAVYKHTLDPKYVAYFFQSSEFQTQKKKYARGAKVIDIKIEDLAKIEIPVPPIEIQKLIVRYLDNFTELTERLTEELKERKIQYAYYRDNLLNFTIITGGGYDKPLNWIKIGSVLNVLRGKRLTKKELSNKGTFPVYHGGIEPIGYYELANRKGGTVMIINVGASAGTVGYCQDDFWSSDGCFCMSISNSYTPKFLYYYLKTREGIIKSRVRKAGVPTLDAKSVEDISLPVISIAAQARIVSILDRFEALNQDSFFGLPAEINARQQQYEYYRDKLLTFKRKAVA